jgi:uncharacterized membrane protein YqjE
MRTLLILVALLFGGLAIAGFVAYGLMSLLLLVISAVCLWIAWKVRPRRGDHLPARRP